MKSSVGLRSVSKIRVRNPSPSPNPGKSPFSNPVWKKSEVRVRSETGKKKNRKSESDPNPGKKIKASPSPIRIRGKKSDPIRFCDPIRKIRPSLGGGLSYKYTEGNGQITVERGNISLDCAYFRLFSRRLRTANFRVTEAISI